MTDQTTGIVFFESVNPEQMGIINLVLACLAEGPLEAEPTVRSLLMRSGLSGSFVSPSDSLRLAMDLGIVSEREEKFDVTPLGQELLSFASWPPYNLLTEEQGRLLLNAILHRAEFAVPLTRLLHKMRRCSDGSLEIVPGTIFLTRDETQCLQALQSLRVVRYSAGTLMMPSTVHQILIDVLETSAALTEAELLRVLEMQRIRAVAAEDYVRDIEIDRLSKGGRRDLARLVERVALRDVAAGYDIRSFELDGSDKYIEVKSSTGTKLRFILTRNEWTFLETHDSAAWIYFVPRVHELTSLKHLVVAIPTPAKWIGHGAHVEAREFLIEIPESIATTPPPGSDIVWLPRREDSFMSTTPPPI